MLQHHSSQTFVLSTSRLLERAAYYGLRSLLVIYMIGEELQLTTEKALQIYSFFTLSFLCTHLLGAIFGDLLLGNKKAFLLGGLIQALGAFSLAVPSTIGLYMGLLLVVIGGGLYTPNLISHFGKLYLSKKKLLDSGFSILILAVNIGAFLGPLSIGLVGGLNAGYGFIAAGILMLLSLVLPLFIKDSPVAETEAIRVSSNRQVAYVIISIFVFGLFWALYELSGFRMSNLTSTFGELSTLAVSQDVLYAASSLFLIPVGIVTIIAWSYYYGNQFIKLAIGFVLAGIAFGILYFIPESPSESHIWIFLCSMLLLGAAELFVSPIVYAIFTKYSNPAYLAIVISISFIPIRLFSSVIGLFGERLYDSPMIALGISTTCAALIAMGLFLFARLEKNKLQESSI